MFDLESAIADWRRRMMAAGIGVPVPLEELESHLREEIGQGLNAGGNEEQAYDLAIEKIGEAGALKTEFKKARGFAGWLGANKTERIYRVLALLWLVYCADGFFEMTPLILSNFFRPSAAFVRFCFLNVIYVRGGVACILLFGGVTRERRFVRVIAVLNAVLCVAMIVAGLAASLLLMCFSIAFSLLSIWLLRPPQKPKLASQ